MGIQQIPLVGAVSLAGSIQTALAASKLRLFAAGYSPTPNDTLAGLAAVECTFSGYTAGGYALTTWNAPIYNPLGGASITSPQVLPTFTAPGSGSPVTNTVGGWFLVSSGGVLIADGVIDNPIAMVANGDGFPITLALIFGNLSTLVQAWVNGTLQ